ncbi:MAG: hypothetical protein JWN76_569 [Chitinophagaceae bacterium]|nr:hypothetical protein [Chitinophagaceae bacterium]
MPGAIGIKYVSMHFSLPVVLGQTILIPGIIGLVYFKRILKEYKPFLYLVWLGILNDNLSLFLIKYNKSNLIDINFFTLVEFIIITWLFYNISLNQRSLKLFISLLVLGTAGWVLDNVIFHGLNHNNVLFQIMYAITFIYLSLNLINRALFTERASIGKNANFLVAIGFLFYFSFRASLLIFYYAGVTFSTSFQQHLYYILAFANALTNLIYAYAILWIPTRQKFTLAY